MTLQDRLTELANSRRADDQIAAANFHTIARLVDFSTYPEEDVITVLDKLVEQTKNTLSASLGVILPSRRPSA